MTEQLKYNLGSEFEDKTELVMSSRFIMTLDNGLECKCDARALPEYFDSDRRLVMKCLNRFAMLMAEKKLRDATFEIEECYSNEPEGKGHFRLAAKFGYGGEKNKFVYVKGYSAEGDHGEVKGEVKSSVSLQTGSNKDYLEMSGEAVSLYIQEMEKTYDGWKNEWEGGVFIFG
jgi:hypothetical protein